MATWNIEKEMHDNIKEYPSEVHGTGSGPCQMAGFGVVSLVPSGSVTITFV
jgi:hypothetical protein